MLYHFLYPLSETISAFNVFRYITTRSFLAFALASIFSIWFGKKFIALMKKIQFGQVIREEGPENHKKKAGTPTLGGVFILGSIVLATLICGNFNSMPLILTLVVTLFYFLLGGLDDYLKVVKKNTDGVSARGKLLFQFTISAIVLYFAIKYGVIDGKLYVPFRKEALLDLGYFYIFFGSFVIVGSSNAVNLTDGLDGLAIGPIITSAASLGVLAYAAGHSGVSTYLFIPYVESVGELVIFTAAVIGAGVGFLWYNSYPAQIFMGDVGSLSLGGALGTLAVMTKNELLFTLIGGIFVVEALSVIIQVFSYKTRRKRVFKMAPIHHHFELLGWPEPKVIVRFWIISIMLAILSIATLKLR
ncbi:MAG: phospho-N-acetylmuramoyl-pentapeptide-transferase [Bacteriovoracaceae bacterium]|nr:phospho-N-acetylmuramoyl-pentapeptide-transferase [Bacteriovoracaceae bacterium]